MYQRPIDDPDLAGFPEADEDDLAAGIFPAAALARLPLPEAERLLRRWRIRRALDASGGNVKRASEMLGLPNSTLVSTLALPGFEAEAARARRQGGDGRAPRVRRRGAAAPPG